MSTAGATPPQPPASASGERRGPSPPRPRSPWRDRAGFAVDMVLHSYSAVLFARSRPIGLLLLLATFVVPPVGLAGLAGVLIASACSLVLQLDRQAVRDGLLGYNALLVFLAIGALLDRSPAFLIVGLAAAFLTVVVHVGLSGALRYHLRLPALSLPFVLVTWVLVAAVPHLRGVALLPHPPAVLLPPLPGPVVLDAFLRSLGAIFFQPHWIAGALVLVALGSWSRIAVVHAALGFAVAWAADAWLLTFPPAFFHVYAGFNIVLTAVALGGIFFVPGPASLMLALGGALASALLTVGSLAILGPVGLPVLALPLNLIVLTTVYALRQRQAHSQPHAIDGFGASPEANLAWSRQRIQRFRTGAAVHLALPVRGSWEVTQGNDGDHTHQGPWRHGLDLEVRGADGALYRGAGTELADHHCFRLPVVAPCDARVVRAVDDRPDTPPGAFDTAHRWGNLVLLQVAPERYLLLAHLAQSSLRVREGDHVRTGQELGRCGASGRAPRPHLHVQLQASPEIGAPTIALGFHDLVQQGDPTTVHTVFSPAEGDVVRNLEPGTRAAGWAQVPVGARLMARVTVDGGTPVDQVLVSSLTLLGARTLALEGQAARLRFETRGRAFLAMGVDGHSPALVALYLALLKIPYDRCLERPGSGLRWADRYDPRAVRGRPGAMLQDVVEAFIPRPQPTLHFTGRRTGATLVVEGSGAGITTTARLGPQGLERVEARWASHSVLLVAEGPWQ